MLWAEIPLGLSHFEDKAWLWNYWKDGTFALDAAGSWLVYEGLVCVVVGKENPKSYWIEASPLQGTVESWPCKSRHHPFVSVLIPNTWSSLCSLPQPGDYIFQHPFLLAVLAWAYGTWRPKQLEHTRLQKAALELRRALQHGNKTLLLDASRAGTECSPALFPLLPRQHDREHCLDWGRGAESPHKDCYIISLLIPRSFTYLQKWGSCALKHCCICEAPSAWHATDFSPPCAIKD